ncbi:probable aspartic proteinase GIP2 [Rutidosis leptorrhynchoides]|uniref:probable aspartic proteinase GIP2 n=1 Tax=Rutidosis leptorrhynchoides TaxID=125765 RepID=UPI003A99AE22
MFHLLKMILFFLAFFVLKHEYSTAQYIPPYTSFFIPLNKHTDAAKPLFSAQIMTSYSNFQFNHSNFLIDIDAPITWHDCIVQWNMYQRNCPENVLCTDAVNCDEDICTEVQKYSYISPYCPRLKRTAPSPTGNCTCPINVMNPVDIWCSQPVVNYDTFFVNTSNGRNPLPVFISASLNAACAPSSSFELFPNNVNGVIAFSSSPYTFILSLDQPPLKKIFSLCLPSTTAAPGILFYGNGPYYFIPNSNVDVRSYLSYTPLLNHPDSFGYFIGVDSIVIKNRSINVPANSTTKLSTIEPYTALRTDIYNSVVRRFSLVTKRLIPTSPVPPFSNCYNTISNGTKLKLKVPHIDLILSGGNKWTISTTNSMKYVTQNVSCLAFVDGGATPNYAIVIGTFQFEDNFLELNLENSTFGFSSSLLRKHTSCSHYNHTIVTG